MLKDSLYICDSIFSHANSSSWYNEPDFFNWVREYDQDHLFFTDFSLHHADNFDNFSTGGLVSFDRNNLPPYIMYMIPLVEIIHYAKLRGMKKLEKAIQPGNYNSVWSAGQSSALIDKTASCEEIINELKKETNEAYQKLHTLFE
jgi:hypothetical protein